jgi:SnoaL-like domain
MSQQGTQPVKDARESQPDAIAIRQLVDELFITTDLKDLAMARALFSDGPIEVDMRSLAGGDPIQMTADQLIDGFRAGLHTGKVSHHLATNYRIEVDGDHADVWCHGYAWNRVPALPAGSDLWETWGNYRLSCRRVGREWRLEGFRYYSKLTRGNDAVRTHTQ